MPTGTVEPRLNERDEIGLMLLTAVFFGSSFWPALMGWVDLLTLAGWAELFTNYLRTLLVISMIGITLTIGRIFACAVHWATRALMTRRSSERELASAFIRNVFRGMCVAVNHAWKLAWWAAASLRKSQLQGNVIEP